MITCEPGIFQTSLQFCSDLILSGKYLWLISSLFRHKCELLARVSEDIPTPSSPSTIFCSVFHHCKPPFAVHIRVTICLKAAWGLPASKASGLHQLEPLEVCHGCMCPWVAGRLIALMLHLSQTICILFFSSQLLIPKGLRRSLFICAPSVECHMQTNTPIHLVNFWTFFLVSTECSERKLPSFPPTHLYGLESCEIQSFLKACWAVLAIPVSFYSPRTPEGEGGSVEDLLAGHWYLRLGRCDTMLVTPKIHALPNIVLGVGFTLVYQHVIYVKRLVLP